ncbi:MAG: MurR/RpiR family transcriptional regulator [Anaerolineae bacterium]|nr:MurR/RpiR family transcriptional regulator [Anaerolineae bacterium]
MLFRDRIRAAYEHFSNSYRKVADFLLDDYRTAAFLNASGVAQHLDVDPATVVRFAQRLGYPGYPELADELQIAVRQELAAAFAPAQTVDTNVGIAREFLRSAGEDIQRILFHNDTSILEDVLNGILSARRVYLIGEGMASRIMEIGAVQLAVSGIDARPVSGGRTDRSIALLGLTSQDIAIGIAPYTVATEIVGTLRTLREAGLRTYVIVRSHSSPAARYADVVILAPQSYRSPLAAYSTHMALLTALAQAIAIQRTQTVLDAILSSSDLWANMLRFDEPQMPDLDKHLEGLQVGEGNQRHLVS